MIAIIHNHPIHYKHLLFLELARLGVDFEVLFTGNSSLNRIERPLPVHGEYKYRFGCAVPYENVSAAQAARSVWGSLSSLRPPVVIISGWYDAAAWTAWLWAQVHRAKAVLWAESNEFDYPRRAWKEFIKKLYLSRIDIAHVYGSSNKAYVVRLGMDPARVFVKRAVADTARFGLGAKPKRRGTQKVLLYVGRFSPEKNLDLLLRVFARIRQDPKNPKMVLHLAGYGPLEEKLKSYVADHDIAPLVSFRGKFPQAELPAIYGEADVLVLPSRREPWGLVVNEAMLCGLPVLVSSQCGCAADLVKPETGWTFSAWDEEELLQRLEAIADLPGDALAHMGINAASVAKEYSPKNCAKIVAETILPFLP